MLRILLIDLGTPREELNEPLGIEVIGGTILQKFSSAVHVHFEFAPFNAGNAAQRYCDYDLVGIAAKIGSMEKIKEIIASLLAPPREETPIVIFGGPLATFAYRELLKVYPDAICVRGEGEDAVCGIIQTIIEVRSLKVDRIKKSPSLRRIPNVAFLHDGELVEREIEVIDLTKSAHPARFSLSQIVERKGIVRIEGSRGCPWGLCTFCSVNAKYAHCGWRPFPTSRIMGELVDLSQAGARNPYFTDEDFVGPDIERAIELAGEILKAKRTGIIDDKLRFFVSMPAYLIVNKDRNIHMLRSLQEAGLRRVFIGLESGSKDQIHRYRKKVTPQNSVEALGILNSLGLDVDIGFIMFDPEMTLNDLEENVDFLQRTHMVDHDARYIKAVRVQPDTELERKLRAKGMLSSELNVDTLTYSYRFEDPIIQMIFDAFQHWEKDVVDIIWSIQANTRGEGEAGDRGRSRMLLTRLRSLDFEFLVRCISVARVGHGALPGNLNRIEGSFKERRRMLLSAQ